MGCLPAGDPCDGQCNEMCEGFFRRLPKTLDETYERVLRDIHEDNK
jgi:hypothetical protein